MGIKSIRNSILELKSNKSSLYGAFFIYVLTFSPSSSMASTLYENAYDGPTAGGSANCTFQCTGSSVIGAAAFDLSGKSTIEQLRLTVWASGASTADVASLSIDWGIRNSNGGLPSSLIDSGTSSPVGTLIDNTSVYNIFELTLDINDVVLDSGSYWATFHVDSTIGSVFWDFNTSGIGSATSKNSGGTWTQNYGSFANVTFGVDGVPAVPVPAAVWLFGSGLLGLVGLARRKKS